MKYTVDSLKPKLAHFLDPLLSRSGFELNYELSPGHSAHPEVENPEVTVQFTGEDTDLLLANRAELLLAIEHLSMEVLHVPPEDHALISFDANDYRLLRIEELRMSALAAADKVKRTRVPFHFNPMTSRERRVIHLALREEKELRSESLGRGSPSSGSHCTGGYADAACAAHSTAPVRPWSPRRRQRCGRSRRPSAAARRKTPATPG